MSLTEERGRTGVKSSICTSDKKLQFYVVEGGGGCGGQQDKESSGKWQSEYKNSERRIMNFKTKGRQ